MVQNRGERNPPGRVPIQDDPGPRKRPYYPVLRPRPACPVAVTCLSARPLGLLTHYCQGRTRGCRGEGHCDLCGRPETPSKWEGYLWAADRSGQVVIVVITAEAYRTCPDLADGVTSLAGRQLTLTRAGAAPNSQVRAAVGTQQMRPERVRQPLDLYGYLLSLWASADASQNGG